MLITIIILAISLIGTDPEEPVYVLEYPGIAFGWLPEWFETPVEGNLTEEAGVVVSEANTSGVEYHILYWKEELVPNTRIADWMEERFRSVISPDILPQLLSGSPEWAEGSMASPYRDKGSIGLVPMMNFNVITDEGTITGQGKACAAFSEDYSVLIYAIAPFDSDKDVRSELDTMISLMYLIK